MEKQGTKVKMCGMMRPEDILTANAVKPDFVGFIFAENRRRTVSAEAVREMKSKLDEGIQTVGVFLNQDVHFVADTANACGLDYIQLHGSEDGEYIRSLKSVTQIPVIQAFVVKDETKLDEANASAADGRRTKPGECQRSDRCLPSVCTGCQFGNRNRRSERSGQDAEIYAGSYAGR